MIILINVNILLMLIHVKLKFLVLVLLYYLQLSYKTVSKYIIWELGKLIKIYLIDI
jgi:hypothetical protein